MTEIYATTDGKRIMVKWHEFDRSLTARVKNVPGARAHFEDDKFDAWWVPLTMGTCRALRKEFGADLKVLPMLSEWARAEVAREDELEGLREGRLGEALKFERLEAEAPALLKAMSNRKYQLAGTAFMKAGGQVILADDPGLGKTLQTLGALIEADAKNILVACRKSATRAVWEREAQRWAPGIATFVAQGSHAEREAAMGAFSDHAVAPFEGARKMLIINIEMVRMVPEVCPYGTLKDCRTGETAEHKHDRNVTDWPFLFGCAWDAAVFDESHNLLASTKNTQSKGITQARYGAVQIRRKIRPGGLAIALSGTPFRSKLTKGWGTLNWLRPDVFGSYWRWAETHFGVEQGQWGRVVAGGAKVPEPKDKDVWDAMLRPYYLRREKALVAPDLPPIIYAGTPIGEDPDGPCYVQLDMDPKQAKAYREMVLDASATLANGRVLATGVLAELTRLRQFADAYGTLDTRDKYQQGVVRGQVHRTTKVIPALPSNKMEWLIDFMQEREGSGRKVVVASMFSEIVKMAAEALGKEGFNCLTLTGATSDRDRSELVSRFQDPDDDVQVVILNTLAGGESITLDAADEMVIIDPPWLADQEKQLTARIHRVSRVHQVTVYRLASTGTVDCWMASMNEEQRQVLLTADPKTLSDRVLEALK